MGTRSLSFHFESCSGLFDGTRMHEPNKYVLQRIGKYLLPILFAGFLCPPACLSQSKPSMGMANQGLRTEIVVTIHDSSGNLLSVPASVKMFCNGTPCDEGSTSNGRISFRQSAMGKFSVLVEAPGYESGQNDIGVNQPNTYQLEITLRRSNSSSAIEAPAGSPILAPKAQEALTSAIQALRENNLVDAEKGLDQALKLAPNNPNVLYEQGLLELKKHQWVKAQTVLEKVIQMEPNSARALAALGMALCNQKKYAEAIPPLEKSLIVDPSGGWETHWSLAAAYYRSQRYDEALKASQQAQEQSNGQVPQVDLLVAEALVAVGRFDDSANVLRDVLKNHAGSPESVTARRYLDRLKSDDKIH